MPTKTNAAAYHAGTTLTVKTIVRSAALLMLLLTALSCSLLPSQTAALTIGLLPGDTPSYNVAAQFFKNGWRISETPLGTSTVDGESWDSFKIPGDATDILIVLKDSTSKSLYFAPLLPGQTSYEVDYWISYEDYFGTIPSKIRYGVSPAAAQTLADLGNVTVDFSQAPYFLFQVSNTAGSDISINYASQGDKVWLITSNSISQIIHDQESAFFYENEGQAHGTSAPLFIYCQPNDYTLSSTAELSFTEVTRALMPDLINYLVPSGSADTMYAITTNSHSIYKVNPLAGSAVLLKQMPLQNIMKLVYSAPDNTLYGYTTNSATLLAYNLNTDAAQTSVFGSGTGKGIDVDPAARRIYACAGNTLYILDQDTFAVLGSGSLGSGTKGDISLNRADHTIYCSDTYAIDKFSVAGDVVSNTGKKYDSMDYYGGFILSHGGSQITYASIGTGVRIVDTAGMTVNSTWYLSGYPGRSVFSTDDSAVYASNSDPFVYRAVADDFSQLQKYYFPAEQYFTNSDDTVLAGFLESDDYSFYFLDITKPGTVIKAAAVGKYVPAQAVPGIYGP